MPTSTRRARRLAAVAVLAIIAVASLGFAAGNTVPNTKAGDGSGTITGYAVSAVHYNLNAADPSNIDSVAFTLDSAPAASSTIKVRLAAVGTWFTCPVAASPTCNTPGATVVSADQLTVVVAD